MRHVVVKWGKVEHKKEEKIINKRKKIHLNE
jgi:hypothetical protein